MAAGRRASPRRRARTGCRGGSFLAETSSVGCCTMLSRILRQVAKGSGGTLPTVDDAVQAPGPVTPGEANAALTSSTVAAPATPPRRIAHFVLLEQLGAGGMGLVFAAFDEHLDRKVAIKLVRPHQAPDRGSAAQE